MREQQESRISTPQTSPPKTLDSCVKPGPWSLQLLISNPTQVIKPSTRTLVWIVKREITVTCVHLPNYARWRQVETSSQSVGHTQIVDTGGFCSVDLAHSNLSQNQERAAWPVWPRVPGQGVGAGGGLNFCITNWAQT